MAKALLFAVIGWLVAWSASLQAQVSATDEIQVLIDVSGSMKQNDPHNLRIEASRLLVNLLPDNAKAGLRLFAEKTEVLSASDAVSPAWKQQAGKATANIHSRGLYTNIEDAIKSVLDGGFAGTGNKHLILLTDGFVDISKDIMESADSRERILSEWIPRLQQMRVKVETIALSAQADKELLQRLAGETGGWAEVAESADQLQRVFVKMAQKAAPKDSLPLAGNRFEVDASIKEFSVLVFKKPGAAPTLLWTPDGGKLGKQSASGNVSWLESANYDLITVREPRAGEWRLEAEVDPDNRVMIVTDLKLQLGELPNFLTEKQGLTVKAHFTDGGQLIDRADFLAMLSLQVTVDQQTPTNMAATGEAGYFGWNALNPGLGKHLLRVVADGKTFRREIVHEFEVVAAPIAVEKQIDIAARRVTLTLVPDTALLDTIGMSVNVGIGRAGQAGESRALTAHDGRWDLVLADIPVGGTTQVSFSVTARGKDGNTLEPLVPPVTIDDSWFVAEPTASETHPAEPDVAADAEHGATHGDAAAGESEDAHGEPVSETNWLQVTGIVLGLNLLIAGTGYFGYRAFKQAQFRKQQALLERLA
ncbi:VWA domain-containing protein [Methylococcaceae bacterium WWC4]|nr:VWA domain-containing protein [Methylococcaceae bacterium WWC4]